MQKKIALIGWFPYKDFPFALRLEESGFEVYWIVKWRSEANWLREHGVDPGRVLDTSPLHQRGGSDGASIAELGAIEPAGSPRIRDIILMDRHLRRESYSFCLRYLGHLAREMTAFLRENGITIATVSNDTALHQLGFLVTRKLGIFCVSAVGTRFPNSRVAFSLTHESTDFLPVRPVMEADVDAARALLAEFLSGKTNAVFYRTASGLRDVIGYLPHHITYFSQVARWSIDDGGSRHNRWTVADLAKQFVERRSNLVKLRYLVDYETEIGDRPYLLYALHQQPESSIDVLGSFFSDQITLITQIARSTPVTHDLYVKIHRADVGGKPPAFYKRLGQIPGVVLIGPEVESRQLLERADIVFTVSGTIAYEAGLMQKPAITFARLFFNDLPTVHYCDSPPRLPDLVSRILQEKNRGPDWTEEIVQFLAGVYACSFPTRHHPLFGTLPKEELDTIAEMYHLLFRKYVLPGARSTESFVLDAATPVARSS